MIRFVLAGLTLIPTLALGNYGSATVNEVTSIYDADTFRANIKG